MYQHPSAATCLAWLELAPPTLLRCSCFSCDFPLYQRCERARARLSRNSCANHHRQVLPTWHVLAATTTGITWEFLERFGKCWEQLDRLNTYRAEVAWQAKEHSAVVTADNVHYYALHFDYSQHAGNHTMFMDDDGPFSNRLWAGGLLDWTVPRALLWEAILGGRARCCLFRVVSSVFLA